MSCILLIIIINFCIGGVGNGPSGEHVIDMPADDKPVKVRNSV